MERFFGAPGMLWWAAAAAVPLVLHLLSRRRHRRVAWAAMALLERAFKKTRKRVRLENVIILLLRMAALILLALALADPHVAGGKLFGAGDRSRNAFLLVDLSFSMEARDASDQSAFQRARRAALELTEQLSGERDAAALITGAAPARIVVPLTREIDRVRDAVEGLDARDAATDLGGGLERIAGLLAEPGLATEHPGASTVYVFTDMQKSAFSQREETPGEASLAGLDPGFERAIAAIHEAGARVVFVDVGEPGIEGRRNVAVEALDHVGRTLVSGRSTDFEARLAHYGDVGTGGELQFFVDRQESFVRSERVEAMAADDEEAAGSSSLLFQAAFDRPGWHSVAVRYVDDALRNDNVRRLAFEVRDRVRVLAVHGGAAREPEEAATFFLARALDPSGSARAGESFSVKEIGAGRLSGERLDDYDLVVLADVPEIPPRTLEELQRWVHAGGALLYFAGPSLEAAGRLAPDGVVDRLFWADGKGLLPARLEAVVGSDEFARNPFELQFETFDHPATAYFEDPRVRPGITRIPVFKIVRAVVDPADDAVRVLATFKDQASSEGSRGDPALVERLLGEGRVMLFTSSADRSWNLYGASPAFVPLMREIAFHLVRRGRRANLLVGEALSASFPAGVRTVRVKRDDDPAVERATTLTADKEAARLVLDDLDRAGFVEIAWDGPGSEEERRRLWAVNVDPAESDLARAEEGWLALHLGSERSEVVRSLDQAIAAEEASTRAALWRWFLWATLAVLLLETVLSRVFTKKQALGGAVAA